MIHRENRDFSVVCEGFSSGAIEHTVHGLGGAAIEAGHVIETLYRGRPERWRVRSITREEGVTLWAATVVPAPALRLVA
ncbi:hypothetical protein MKK55_18015 [Methylobacterium sp. J-059]|uniref:hypothetical protein n=1 Tax=Methylobacterium sp. J-059 TaxID=2836643 RepID=UPI001FBBDD6B|nr:hypothetical protein [Methylobacterium sp. J-059]MCJ2040829.1 hypothetical protein [Methylobacterium sp. J-059]